MRRAGRSLALAGALCLLGFAAPAEPGLIWQGQSGGYEIRWTGEDATALGPGGAAFSLRQLAADGLAAHRDPKAPARGCTYERRYKLLSVVGSYLSFEDQIYLSCPGAAHPQVVSRYTAVELGRPGALRYEPDGFEIPPDQRGPAALLTELFPEQDVLAALLADGVVQKTLGRAGQPPPASLGDLLERLGKASAASRRCEWRFGPDLLTRFAFHHLEAGRVAVRLGLSNGGEPCRGKLTQIGILLPVPEGLAPALRAAAARTGEGFLMQAAADFPEPAETIVEATF